MTKLGMAINKTRCIGCQTCAFACKMQNGVPQGMRWNRVLTEGCDVEDGALGEFPNLTRTYLPLACQHCENPACQRVCPTGATYKDDKGRVQVTTTNASGAVCAWRRVHTTPRVFNWSEPVRDPDFNYGGRGGACALEGRGGEMHAVQRAYRQGRGAHVRSVLPHARSHLRRLGRSGQRDIAHRPRAKRLRAAGRAGHETASLLLRLRGGGELWELQ